MKREELDNSHARRVELIHKEQSVDSCATPQKPSNDWHQVGIQEQVG